MPKPRRARRPAPGRHRHAKLMSVAGIVVVAVLAISVTGAVSPPPGSTAAERFGWGEPLPASDEFDYVGPPDAERWVSAEECGPGHQGKGRRCASRTEVRDGKLVQTGLVNGDSAWLASRFNQRYGRWEARVRSTGLGPNNGRADVEVQQEIVQETACGAPLSSWHTSPSNGTPDHVAGFIDGEEWYRLSDGANDSRATIQDMPSGHLTIQLDNFFGDNLQPATYEIDWVRIYALPGQPQARLDG